MTGASENPDGEESAAENSDPTVACMSIVSWSMAFAAIAAVIVLALSLMLLGVSQYVFLMVLFIGAPFAAAIAALLVLFLQLNQNGGAADAGQPHGGRSRGAPRRGHPPFTPPPGARPTA